MRKALHSFSGRSCDDINARLPEGFPFDQLKTRFSAAKKASEEIVEPDGDIGKRVPKERADVAIRLLDKPAQFVFARTKVLVISL